MNLPRHWGRALLLSLALVSIWMLFALSATPASVQATSPAQAQGDNPFLWSTGVFIAWIFSESTLGAILAFVLTRFTLSTNAIRAITVFTLLLGQAVIVLFLPLLPPEIRDQPTLMTIVSAIGAVIAWVSTRASALWQASALMKLPEVSAMGLTLSEKTVTDPSLERALKVYRM